MRISISCWQGWRSLRWRRTAATRSTRRSWFRRGRPWKRPERPVAGEPARGGTLAPASLYATRRASWWLACARTPLRLGAVCWRCPGRVTEPPGARVVDGDGPGRLPACLHPRDVHAIEPRHSRSTVTRQDGGPAARSTPYPPSAKDPPPGPCAHVFPPGLLRMLAGANSGTRRRNGTGRYRVDTAAWMPAPACRAGGSTRHRADVPALDVPGHPRRARHSSGVIAPSRAVTWMLPGDVPGRVKRCRTAWRPSRE